MKRVNFKSIYRRTKELLLKPESIWPTVLEEEYSPRDVYRNYLIPVAILSSLCVLLISIVPYNFFQASGLAIINFISGTLGIWFSYLITREYLCGKLNYEDHFALNLTIYSGAIFIFFHSLGTALGNGFLGQLLTLLSFIFIRTLYIGLGQLSQLQSQHKTNILIITSLTIICLPVIISQLLKIIFGISAFNV